MNRMKHYNTCRCKYQIYRCLDPRPLKAQSGKANTSSVKPGKSVSFDASASDAQTAMMAKLAVIVGRAQGNKN